MSGVGRRVLTLPSGVLVCRKLELNLFVGLLGGGGGLSLGLAIGRGEDAEGDGDASLKVQVDDCCRRERIFSYNLPNAFERKTRRILWLLFLKKQKREKEGRKERVRALLLLFCLLVSCEDC